MSKKKLIVIIAACIVAIIVIVTVARPTVGPLRTDEQQIRELVRRGIDAWNSEDYQLMYETMSPNYRQTASYQEFRDYHENLRSLLVLGVGTDQMTIDEDSIEITIINGEWAYVTYRIWIDGTEVDLVKEGQEDILRKVGGKWYDVTELLDDPGYNTEDLP